MGSTPTVPLGWCSIPGRRAGRRVAYRIASEGEQKVSTTAHLGCSAALTEVASALARRLREGALPTAAARRVHRKILATVAEGAFRRLDLLSVTHREAERLLLASDRVALRAADALHLALELGASTGTMLTYDRTLERAALTHGLAVYPGDAG